MTKVQTKIIENWTKIKMKFELNWTKNKWNPNIM